MECSQCSSILYEYVDGLLDINTQQEVQRHLQECSQCREEWQEYLEAIALYRIQVKAPMLGEDFAVGVIAGIARKEKQAILAIPFAITGVLLILAMLGALIVLPIVFPLLLLTYGILVEILPVPFIILMAFPTAKGIAALLLSLVLLLITLIMRRLVLH